MNTKAAYSSAVLLMFVRNIHQRSGKGGVCNSMSDVVRFADGQMRKLGIENKLSESTKYSVVKDLIDSKILITRVRKKGKKHSVQLSEKVYKYVCEAASKVKVYGSEET